MLSSTSHAEDALVVATIVLAVFTAGLWYATYRMASKSSDAIEIAKEALDHDRERWQADLQERRERGARECFLRADIYGGDGNVHVQMTNFGRKPIRRVQFFVACKGNTASTAETDAVGGDKGSVVHWFTGVLGIDKPEDVKTWVTFYDYLGHCWSLTPEGALHEYDGNPNTFLPRTPGAIGQAES